MIPRKSSSVVLAAVLFLSGCANGEPDEQEEVGESEIVGTPSDAEQPAQHVPAPTVVVIPEPGVNPPADRPGRPTNPQK